MKGAGKDATSSIFNNITEKTLAMGMKKTLVVKKPMKTSVKETEETLRMAFLERVAMMSWSR